MLCMRLLLGHEGGGACIDSQEWSPDKTRVYLHLEQHTLATKWYVGDVDNPDTYSMAAELDWTIQKDL